MFFNKKFGVCRDCESLKARIEEYQAEIKKLRQECEEKIYNQAKNFRDQTDENNRNHAQALHKMELECKQVLADLKMEYDAKMLSVKREAQEEIYQERQKLQTDFVQKITNSLEELHSKGNVTTRFVQDMALQLAGNTMRSQKLAITEAIGSAPTPESGK